MDSIQFRVLRAAHKRGDTITQTQLTRYVTRIDKEDKRLALNDLIKKKYLHAIVEHVHGRRGRDPVIYFVTALGLAALDSKK